MLPPPGYMVWRSQWNGDDLPTVMVSSDWVMCSCDVWIENSTHQASRRHLNESSVRIDVLSKATPPPVSGTPGNTTLLSLFGILVILVCIATYPVWKGPLHSKHQQTMSILFHPFPCIFARRPSYSFRKIFRGYQLHPACLHFLQVCIKPKRYVAFDACKSWQRWFHLHPFSHVFSPRCTKELLIVIL